MLDSIDDDPDGKPIEDIRSRDAAVVLRGALALLLASDTAAIGIRRSRPARAGTPGDVQVGRRGRHGRVGRARRARPGHPGSDSKADFEVFDSRRAGERSSDFYVGESPDQPRAFCSTSAAAWRSAATWTARARPSAVATMNLHGAAGRGGAVHVRLETAARSSTSRRTCSAIRARQPRRESRGDRRRSMTPSGRRRRLRRRAREQASRTARDHRRRRHWQPADGGRRCRRSRARSTCRCICWPSSTRPIIRAANSRSSRPTAQEPQTANAGRPGAMDRRRHARRERARAHGRRLCRICSTELRSSVPHHLRAGRPSGVAPARDSYAEEET